MMISASYAICNQGKYLNNGIFGSGFLLFEYHRFRSSKIFKTGRNSQWKMNWLDNSCCISLAGLLKIFQSRCDWKCRTLRSSSCKWVWNTRLFQSQSMGSIENFWSRKQSRLKNFNRDDSKNPARDHVWKTFVSCGGFSCSQSRLWSRSKNFNRDH